MAIFAISFRISEADGKPAYEAAYKAVTDSVKDIGGTAIWDGTTSFYVLESRQAAAVILERLYKPRAVRTKDEILVIDLSSKDWSFWPHPNPAPLETLLNRR